MIRRKRISLGKATSAWRYFKLTGEFISLLFRFGNDAWPFTMIFLKKNPLDTT